MNLKSKKCIPCEGGIPKLNEGGISANIKLLNSAWTVIHGTKIQRKFNFVSFRHTMDFVNSVANLAEDEGHHPDMYISYGTCIIELMTHAINGLSENDFILAAKIDELI